MIVCPDCGADQPDGAWRCNAERDDGTRCGKDLTNVGTSSAGGTSAVGGAQQ